ncbi:MAG: hypothetical protein ABGX27_02185 [Desulfurobacteriaceae bacterium]
MRGLIVLLSLFLSSYVAWACSSDCYQCHVNIPKDSNHKVLSSCTDCHPKHEEKSFNSKCGADCFDCHSVNKVMKLSLAHSVLKKCVECHTKLKDSEVNELYNRLFN